jgi:hypothetical protein
MGMRGPSSNGRHGELLSRGKHCLLSWSSRSDRCSLLSSHGKSHHVGRWESSMKGCHGKLLSHGKRCSLLRSSHGDHCSLSLSRGKRRDIWKEGVILEGPPQRVVVPRRSLLAVMVIPRQSPLILAQSQSQSQRQSLPAAPLTCRQGPHAFVLVVLARNATLRLQAQPRGQWQW